MQDSTDHEIINKLKQIESKPKDRWQNSSDTIFDKDIEFYTQIDDSLSSYDSQKLEKNLKTLARFEIIKKLSIIKSKHNESNIFDKGISFFINIDSSLENYDNIILETIIKTLSKNYQNEKELKIKYKEVDHKIKDIDEKIKKIEKIEDKNRKGKTDINTKELTKQELESLKQTLLIDYEIYQKYEGIFHDLTIFFKSCDDDDANKIINAISSITPEVLSKVSSYELPGLCVSVTKITNEFRSNLIQCAKGGNIYNNVFFIEAIFKQVILCKLHQKQKNIIIAAKGDMLNLEKIENADKDTNELSKYGPLYIYLYKYIIDDTYDYNKSFFRHLFRPLDQLLNKTQKSVNNLVSIDSEIPKVIEKMSIDDETPEDITKGKRLLSEKKEIANLCIRTLWLIKMEWAEKYLYIKRMNATVTNTSTRFGDSNSQHNNKILASSQKIVVHICKIYEEYGREAFKWVPPDGSCLKYVTNNNECSIEKLSKLIDNLLNQLEYLYSRYKSVQEAFNDENINKWRNEFTTIYNCYMESK